MKTKILKSILFIGVSVAFLSFDLPTGWKIAGDKAYSYQMGIDKGAGQDGKNAATIKSIAKRIDGFGTLMQNCSADNYLGKRIRLSGMLKTRDVTDWCGFWLRINQKGSTEPLGYDNMHEGKVDRSVSGTQDWAKHEIVLDVPSNASNIAFGALLFGPGQIWFDNLKFEVVDQTVPTTGAVQEVIIFKEPVNLDFEK